MLRISSSIRRCNRRLYSTTLARRAQPHRRIAGNLESENGAADSDSSADAPKDTRMNDTWGNKKQSYYAKDSGSEGLDSSEAEEDQL